MNHGLNGPLLWIRHGTCVDGLTRPHAHPRPTSPLARPGAREIHRTAQALKLLGYRPALIACSPLRRSVDSARLLGRVWDVPVAEPIAEFAEWRAPVCVLGRAPDHYPALYRAWRAQRHKNVDSTPEGGESLRALAGRAHRARETAERLADDHGRVVVISHRLLIGSLAALAVGITDPADSFIYARRLVLPPAGWWAQTQITPGRTGSGRGEGR